MKKIFTIAMVSLLIAIAGCTSKSRQVLENKKIEAKSIKDSIESQERFQAMFLPYVGEYDMKFFIKKQIQFHDKMKSYLVIFSVGQNIVYNFSGENFEGVLTEEISGILHGDTIYLKDEGKITNHSSLKFSSKEEFSYEEFKSIWLFEDLLPYIKEFELSVWDNEDRSYPIENYEHFMETFDKGCKVFVSPRPAGILRIGSFKKLVGQNGIDWWFRQNSMIRRGESYFDIK